MQIVLESTVTDSTVPQPADTGMQTYSHVATTFMMPFRSRSSHRVLDDQLTELQTSHEVAVRSQLCMPVSSMAFLVTQAGDAEGPQVLAIPMESQGSRESIPNPATAAARDADDGQHPVHHITFTFCLLLPSSKKVGESQCC